MLGQKADSSKKTGVEKKKHFYGKIRLNDEVQHPDEISPALSLFPVDLLINPRLENRP